MHFRITHTGCEDMHSGKTTQLAEKCILSCTTTAVPLENHIASHAKMLQDKKGKSTRQLCRWTSRCASPPLATVNPQHCITIVTKRHQDLLAVHRQCHCLQVRSMGKIAVRSASCLLVRKHLDPAVCSCQGPSLRSICLLLSRSCCLLLSRSFSHKEASST